MSLLILICGGGIGGLAAALALAGRGHRVELLEQAGSFGEVGAGIQLGPNVARRLQGLGLAHALDSVAARPVRLCVRDAATGAERAGLALADMPRRYGAPYFCVHRADLHAALLAAVRHGAAAERVVLHAAARVQHVHLRGDGRVGAGSDDARAWAGDALIGADGLWSAVRVQVVPGDLPPLRTGHTAWRALLPQADLPAALRSDEVQVWLGPRLHAVAYPVRRGAWLNLVVLAESAPAGDARDWDQSTSLAALQQATGQMAPGLQALLEAVPAWRAWTLHDRAPLAGPQQMARGRIALLGDAAHPMRPYLAQGAGMAIEDAVALAEPLGEGAAAADVPAALARYAQARWARNARVQARARRNGRVFHATGVLRAGRDAALRLLGPRLLDQPWLFGG